MTHWLSNMDPRDASASKKCVLSFHFNPAHIWPDFSIFHEFSDCHFPFPIICAILAPGLLFYGPKYIWSVANVSMWGKIKRGIIEKVHIDHHYFECQMWHCIQTLFFEFFSEVKFVRTVRTANPSFFSDCKTSQKECVIFAVCKQVFATATANVANSCVFWPPALYTMTKSWSDLKRIEKSWLIICVKQFDWFAQFFYHAHSLAVVCRMSRIFNLACSPLLQVSLKNTLSKGCKSSHR